MFGKRDTAEPLNRWHETGPEPPGPGPGEPRPPSASTQIVADCCVIAVVEADPSYTRKADLQYKLKHAIFSIYM